MSARQHNKPTDCRDNEQSLYTHDRFHSFVEASANVFWITTLEGAILEESPSWSAFTRQESTSYKGKGWLQAIYPEDRTHFEKMLRQTIETGQVTSFECRICQDDGQYHKVRIQSIPIRDIYGNIYEWMGSGTDITLVEQGEHAMGAMLDIPERKNVEAALRESEAKFRRLVDANVIGVLITNIQEGNVLEANAAFLSLAGYNQQDLVAGRLLWQDLTTPEFADRNEKAVHEILSTGVLTPFESELLTKDGKRIPTLIAGALLEQSNDTAICFILDMTPQKDADKQKDAFISLISHELRTPLTSIKGNIQLAQRRLKRLTEIVKSFSAEDQTVTDEVELLLERAVQQAGIQNRLIDDLLDVSRIDANKLELSPSLHDLVALVHETVENLHSTIPNCRLLFEHSEHAQVPVMVDTDRIGQVVANYITNAVKYSAASEPVIVGLTVEGAEAKVWVRDFGPGLTVEEQEKVWRRFYQIPNGQIHSGHKVGLGLGLYICQTLIKRHNGRVGVESQLGQGSTFWFTLPIVK